MFNKEKNNCCCAFTIIASILLGFAIGAVFFEGLIVAITALLYITLVFGLISLVFVLFLFFCNRKSAGCFCLNNSCLITTIIGSIISSLFALTLASIAVDVFATAFLIGVVAFFLFTNLVNMANVIFCLYCTKKCE